MLNRRFALIEAPSILGLFPNGVELLAEMLIRAGLGKRLQARHAGKVDPPPYDARIDYPTGVLNAPGIALYTPKLADAVGAVLDLNEFPIVLGGDCSVMLGGLLALRRKMHPGLLFLDAHADFYQPEAEPGGEAASMDLAFATGYGPVTMTHYEGFHPLVREHDVAVLARRDAEDAEEHGSRRIEDTAIAVVDLAAVRKHGIHASTALALQRVARSDLEGFWIHLDADVLDDAINPAVDYRLPGGLTFDELSSALRAAVCSGRALGMTVTIFNPKLDDDGHIAQALVASIERGLLGGV